MLWLHDVVTSTQDLPLAACHPTRIRWWGVKCTHDHATSIQGSRRYTGKTYTNSVDEYLITSLLIKVFPSNHRSTVFFFIDLLTQNFQFFWLHWTQPINPPSPSPLPPVPPVSLPTCYLHSSKFSACWVHCFTKRSRKEWGIRPFFRSQERRWRKVASTRCWRCGKNPLEENTGELQMGRLWLNWLNTPWHSGISWTSSSILLKKYWYCLELQEYTQTVINMQGSTVSYLLLRCPY